MEEKKDLQEIIFRTFQNSLEAYELYQQDLLKRNKQREQEEALPPETKKIQFTRDPSKSKEE